MNSVKGDPWYGSVPHPNQNLQHEIADTAAERFLNDVNFLASMWGKAKFEDVPVQKLGQPSQTLPSVPAKR